MSLRTKTLFALGAVFVGLVVLLYIALRLVLLDGFEKLEQDDAQRNIERVLNALDQQQIVMAGTNSDWAHWDDTYEFALGTNPEYPAENLTIETLASLELNLMLFTNPSGEVIHSYMIDLDTWEERPISPEMEAYFVNNAFLYQHEDTSESLVSGIANLSDGPMLITSRAILTNESEGPRAGVMLIGRFLDKTQIAALGEQTQLSLTFTPCDAQADVDFTKATGVSSGGSPIIIDPQNADIVTGFAQVNDISGNPAFVVQVDIPRDIYTQGQTTLRYILAALVIAGIVSGIAMLLLMERSVLNRLVLLSSTVEAITASKDPSRRVTTIGNDELGSLGSSMNTMLSTLEESQHQLTEQAEQLRIASYKAKEAARVRSEFLANMSHELRTPLNAIIGFSDIVLMGINGPLNDQQTHQMTRLKANGERLLYLVNDILDIARIEAKRVELNPIPFSPQKLIKRLAAQVEPLALEKRLEFNISIAPNIPAILVADHQRIEQVVINLLSNAFKFTEEGAVTLVVTIDQVAHNWQIKVIDTGVGIPPHALDLIFEEFRQVDGSSQRVYGGTGLGLAIARNLVRIMEGQLTVKSELGRGSTFIITLPMLETSAKDENVEQFTPELVALES